MGLHALKPIKTLLFQLNFMSFMDFLDFPPVSILLGDVLGSNFSHFSILNDDHWNIMRSFLNYVMDSAFIGIQE